MCRGSRCCCPCSPPRRSRFDWIFFFGPCRRQVCFHAFRSFTGTNNLFDIGSLAAGIQSVVYGGAVASGSAFAWAQSVAMGGAALAGVQAGAGGAAAIAGTAAAGAAVGATANTHNEWPADFVVSDELLERIRHA